MRLDWRKKATIPLSIAIVVAVVAVAAIVSLSEACFLLGLLPGGDGVVLVGGTLCVLWKGGKGDMVRK